MTLLNNIINKVTGNTEEKLALISKSEEELNSLFFQMENFLHGKTFIYQYEEAKAIESWQQSLETALKLSQGFLYLFRNDAQKQLKATADKAEREMKAFPEKLKLFNDKLLDEYIEVAYQVIGKIEGRFLDRQQMACVVKEPISQLVVAGAGSGKTTTIIGKVKYLTQMGLYQPHEILLLSFTRAAALEMKDRIIKETGLKVNVQTIHSLGLNIIKKVDGKAPLIYQGNSKQFILEQIKCNMKVPEYAALLSKVLLFNHIGEKSEWDFQSQEDYDNYLKFNKPTSIRREVMKSYGEVDIANFLAQYGIKYVYEASYKIDTRDSEYGQYRPDFYLPDYNIYIEYFGINRQGQVPDYFKGKEATESAEAMTASEAYWAGMVWKRQLHKENGTILIECYAYEKWEHCLLENLKLALEKKKIPLKEKSLAELIKVSGMSEDKLLEGIAEVMGTIISLAKGRSLASDNLVDFCMEQGRIDQLYLAKLTQPVMEAYENLLKEHDAIDFSDMLNKAIGYVKEGKFVNTFKYVIVDEYQDLSRNQFLLLKVLRESQDYHLLAVGDDWQSIYRFNGSDINYIVNFNQFWGSTEISRIETTYRFSQSLIDISGFFIMKNPAQLKKKLRAGIKNDSVALSELRLLKENDFWDVIAEIENLPENSSVFFLGRYNFDIKQWDGKCNLSVYYDKEYQTPRIKLASRPDLNIHYYSAHRSKGLQADYVFIINTKKYGMGFPSSVESADLVELLLEKKDDYPYAEERRLFYVAMTRAKKKLYLVTLENNISEFVEELREEYKFSPLNVIKHCPRCGGVLRKIKGRYGSFYGCSNYKSNGCLYKIKE